ncbi:MULTISPECIES: hypothetical protein [unclassified Nostoc]|uniref:hypothetical protein n=1 Tax=unclassified Nostoc TaxID=2593658 RepID=UPI0016890394|nr:MULTISPECIES: hypothetical protein [unclassified Nostoc]
MSFTSSLISAVSAEDCQLNFRVPFICGDTKTLIFINWYLAWLIYIDYISLLLVPNNFHRQATIFIT